VRRLFLGALLVVVVSALVLPAAGGGADRPAVAAPLAHRVDSPVKHVIVLYLENQTFDSIEGYWCDDHPGRCPDGGMPAKVKLSNGAVVTPQDYPDVVPEEGHRVNDQTDAINGGKMNAWQKVLDCQAPKYSCIGGYKPAQEPNLISLLDQFATADRFFSLADSPSFGGHLDIVTSNLDGFLGNRPGPTRKIKPAWGWGCDSDQVAAWSATPGGKLQGVPSCVPDYALSVPNGGAFEKTPVAFEPTIMDELSEAGDSWKLYSGRCLKMTTESNGLLTCEQGEPGYAWAICPVLAQCLYTQSAQHAVPTGQVLTDAQQGKLPNFAVITPTGPYALDSEHNGFSMTAGDDFVGKVASAIMNGPEWKSTVLFITWDDCGCFYDGVAPPRNADGTQEGPRVPIAIVSPFAKHAYTMTQKSSFASILAFTEHNYGLPALGVNDEHAYDMASAFDYSQAPLGPVRMIYCPQPRGDHIDLADEDDDT